MKASYQIRLLQEASLKSALKGGRKTIPSNFVEIIDTLVDKVASYKGVVLSDLAPKPQGNPHNICVACEASTQPPNVHLSLSAPDDGEHASLSSSSIQAALKYMGQLQNQINSMPFH